MQIGRSYLFAPGNHARRVEKALNWSADAAILDLEDAVAVREKPATRALVAAALRRPRSCRAYVRVNDLSTPFAFEDIEAVVVPGLDGLVLPKVEGAEQVWAVDWMLAGLERRRGLQVGSIDLMPIIETARGMTRVREIASSAPARLRRLAFGAGDYTLDLGITWSLAEAELGAARAEMVLASRAGGREPPVDSVFVHLKETEALKASTALVRALGFQGKLCIHPDQVDHVNAAFTPGEAEVAAARRVVAAFEAAEADGSASIQVDGAFVDYPIVENARRALALAAALGVA